MPMITLSTEAYAQAQRAATIAGVSIQDWLGTLILDRTGSDFPFDDCGFPSPALPSSSQG